MRRLTFPASSALVRRWPIGFRYHADGPLLVGNKATSVVRDAEMAKITLSDFVGTFDTNMRKKAIAGEILSYLDLCGARAATTFIVGYETWTQGLAKIGPDLSLTTVAFNSFVFRRPVYAGDLLVVNGSVIFAGNSSVGVCLDVARQGYECRTPIHVGECYLTMVCLSLAGTNKSVKNIVPALRLTSSVDKERYNFYCSMRQIQQEAMKSEELNIQKEYVEDDVNQSKPIKVTIAETATFGARMFNPSDLNINNTIFGGCIISWMEKHACHCGRLFTGCPHIHTIGMHDMMFTHPLYTSDCTKLEAKVVYVRHTTMEIDVDLRVERNGEFITSIRASFVLICMNDAGKKIFIEKGLDLARSSPRDLEAYAKARRRYRYSSELKRK